MCRLEHSTMRFGALGLMLILACGILVAPLVTDAQRAGKVVHIGVLSPYAPPSSVQPSPIGP